MLKIIPILITPFQQLCRVAFDTESKEAIVVDPGGDTEFVLEVLEDNSLKCLGIWLTHSHLDHCGGVKKLKEKISTPLFAHPNEQTLRQMVVSYCAMFGVPQGDMDDCPEPDHALLGVEQLQVGAHEFQVLFTPGHSPGHLCFYCKDSTLLLAGDTIFAGSIGRTDLPGGNYDILISSIKNSILVLSDDTKILSGHGPDTSVGVERKTNPFLIE